MSGRQCDNASAGVLIERDGRWLFLWRASFPPGVAPVAGHVFDEHRSYEDAARAEVKEEAGLSVESLSDTGTGRWRANRCRRVPGAMGQGHLWKVYTATVSGELAPSQREVKRARWLSRPQVQLLANRTMLRATGAISEEDFREYPGIEPVWVSFLVSLDLISMATSDLMMIDLLMRS